MIVATLHIALVFAGAGCGVSADGSATSTTATNGADEVSASISTTTSDPATTAAIEAAALAVYVDGEHTEIAVARGVATGNMPVDLTYSPSLEEVVRPAVVATIYGKYPLADLSIERAPGDCITGDLTSTCQVNVSEAGTLLFSVSVSVYDERMAGGEVGDLLPDGGYVGDNPLPVVSEIAVVSTGSATPSTSEQPNDFAFMMPSGNIACIAVDDVLRCDIAAYNYTIESANCELDYGSSVFMWADSVDVGCVGDTIANEPKITLDYGQTIGNSWVTCTSEKTGVWCTNHAGNQFSIARARILIDGVDVTG